MISDTNALDRLKNLLNVDEHLFAPSLCNFLCELKKNEELCSAINAKATAEKAEDSSSLIARETQLLKVIKTEYEKVEQYYKEHSIELPIGFMGVEGISEFRAYELGKIVSLWHIIDSLIQAYSNMLSNLMGVELDQEEVLNFTKKFIVFNSGQNNQTSNLKLNNNSPKSIQKIFNEIEMFVVDKKIINKNLNQILQDFHKLKNDDQSIDQISCQETILLTILQVFFNTNFNTTHHLDFVKQFALTNDNGDITELKLYTVILEWEAETRSLDRIQKGKFWYIYKQLKRFHSLYHNFENLRIDVLKKGKILEEWQLCEDFKNIDAFITINDLKFYQKQILNFIEQAPQQKVSQNELPLKKANITHNQREISIRLDNEEIQLSIKDKEPISFKKYDLRKNQVSLRFKLLLLLSENPQGIKKRKLQEKLNVTDKQIDKAINGINERINDEWYLKIVKQHRRRRIIIINNEEFNFKFNNIKN